MTDNTTMDRCTHGGDCTVHPGEGRLHNYDADELRAEVEQWRAAFGESALKNAQNVLAEREQLRAENIRLRGKLADLGKPVDADHWVNLDGKCEADCPECAAVRALAVTA